MTECGCINECVDSETQLLIEGYESPWGEVECSECGRKLVEERCHISVFLESDGEPPHVRILCCDCDSIIEEFFCSGYFFGRVRQSLWDHIIHVEGQISSECLLRLTPGARDVVIKMIDTLWHDDDFGDDDEY